jgi:hypothetical protein
MLYFYYYPVPISKLYYNIKNNEKLDSLINETSASFLNSFLFKAQLGLKGGFNLFATRGMGASLALMAGINDRYRSTGNQAIRFQISPIQ